MDFITRFDYKQLEFVLRLNESNKVKKKLCEIEAEPASLFLFLKTTEQILFSRGDV